MVKNEKELHVQIPIEVFKKLKVFSATNDMTIKELTIKALLEYIEKNK